MVVGSNDSPGGVYPINGEPNASAPFAVPATAGLSSTLIAWQHDPGGGGPRDVRIRYAPATGPGLAGEQVLSSASQGSTDAGSGIAAAGDGAGDAAVAWVQDAGAPQIVVAQMYQPPAPFGALSSFRYTRSSNVVLAWSPPTSWGPMTYTVTVDGIQVGQTGATAFAIRLRDGSHTWRVTATNPAGQQNTMPTARVFVDTVKPKGSFKVTGKPEAGSAVRLTVKDSDGPRGRASGIAKVTVYWGDGTPRGQISHTKTHVYARAGRFRIRVVIQDKAGNTTTLTRVIKVASAPKSKSKSKSSGGTPVRKG
jgi:hypothetical protein